MNGIQLGELDSSDMLDVVHYMFEKDMNSSTYEQAEAKDALRKQIYPDFYNREYKYATTSSGATSSQQFDYGDPEDDALADVAPFDPLKPKDIKPYTPPTKFNAAAANPFSGVLDAPMN